MVLIRGSLIRSKIVFTSLKTNTAVDHSAKSTEDDHKSTMSGYYSLRVLRRQIASKFRADYQTKGEM